MQHSRELGHNLDGHFGFGDLEELGFGHFRREPFPDRRLDVGQGFLAGLALRMAATQRRSTHRGTVLMLDQQYDAVRRGDRAGAEAEH